MLVSRDSLSAYEPVDSVTVVREKSTAESMAHDPSNRATVAENGE